MKLVSTVFAAVFALAAAGWLFNNPGGVPRNVVNKFHTNTYVITNTSVIEKRFGIGTGVWLNEWYVLTNCHVAKAFERTYMDDGQSWTEYEDIRAVKYDQSIQYNMEVIACDEDKDLALLKARWPNHEAEEIAINWVDPNFGQKLYSAGYRMNLPLAPKVGYAGEQLLIPGRGVRLNVTMPIAGGDSGSPIFDRYGRLRALVVSVYAFTTFMGNAVPVANISLAVPGISIATFLEEHMQ